MFTPAPMRQVNVFVDKNDVEDATIALARCEAFHLNPQADDGDEKVPHWSELADRYASQKQHLDGLLDALRVARSPMPPPQRLSPGADAGDAARVIEAAEEVIGDWRSRRREAEKTIRHLDYLVKEMELLAPLDIPVEQLRNPTYMHWVVGTLPRENLESLRLALFENATRSRRHSGARRIHIFLPESEVEQATLALLKSGAFEPEQTTGKDWAEKTPRWKDLADTYADQVTRIKGLMDALGIDRPDLPLSEQAAPEKEAGELSAKLDALENAIHEWQDSLVREKQEIENLEEQIRIIGRLEPADLPIAAFRNGTCLHWVFGTLPKKQLNSLKCEASGIPAVLVPIDVSGDRAVVAGATVRTHARVFESLLESLSIELFSLPDNAAATPADTIEALTRRRDACKQRLGQIEKEGEHAFSGWRQQLRILWRRARTNARVVHTISGFARHGEIFLVAGQVPDNQIDTIIMTVENATDGRADVEILDSRGTKDLPVEVMLFRIPFVVLPAAVTDHGRRLLVVAATASRYADILEGAVRGVFMEPVNLPEDVTGTPAEILSDLQKRLAAHRERLVDLESERQRLARQWGRRLLLFRQVISADLEVARAVTRFSLREDLFLISGWVPEAEVDRLVTRLETTTEGRTDIEVIEPRPGGRRHPPTLTRNPRFLRPFEAIVDTFGTPGYGEIDPTPLAALTYTVMYGIMFGDVGHGLLLALFGGILRYRARGEMPRALGAILAASGIFAMVFGVFYGTVFGSEHILPGFWIRPIADIMRLMTYSVIGGIVLLTLGFFAAMANALRTKNWGALLFGPSGMAGLWFYWALIGGGYAVVRGMLPLWIEGVLLAVPAVFLLLHEPLARRVNGERGQSVRLRAALRVEAFFELFETLIRNFSNTLSFVRLGAFAVAHAGLMRVVFLLADSAGMVSGWLILVAGTIFVVGFEGLVVAIQALRLEYYEFFSKFFDGRGSVFEPFRLVKAE